MEMGSSTDDCKRMRQTLRFSARDANASVHVDERRRKRTGCGKAGGDFIPGSAAPYRAAHIRAATCTRVASSIFPAAAPLIGERSPSTAATVAYVRYRRPKALPGDKQVGIAVLVFHHRAGNRDRDQREQQHDLPLRHDIPPAVLAALVPRRNANVWRSWRAGHAGSRPLRTDSAWRRAQRHRQCTIDGVHSRRRALRHATRSKEWCTGQDETANWNIVIARNCHI